MSYNLREKHLLWMILEFPITRYIMSNEVGRIDGAERADQHIYISKIISHFLSGKGGCYTIRGINDEYPPGWKEIHDRIAINITDKMDETIGFVIDRALRADERKRCAKNLFELIWENLDEFLHIVNNSKPGVNLYDAGYYNGY